MSVVERAAQRLEELRRAGSQVSGDLAYAPSSTAAGGPLASTIERAAQKLGALDANRAASIDVPPANQVLEISNDASGDAVDHAAFARREPRLMSTAPSTPSGLSSAPRKAQTVELDRARLASAGYLASEEPDPALAYEFRKIKRPLIQACQGKAKPPVENANRILVTSSVPGEGKSFVALNLALSMAKERDNTVLLIDADTTRPALSRTVGLASKPGLLDLLAGKLTDVSDALYRTNIDRLTLLPAGLQRRHATELLASEAMERLVQHLASRYADRILIFDAPPLLGAAEPAALASHMGQILVVVEANRTTHKVLRSALTTIQSCPHVMAVLNKVSNTDEAYDAYSG